MGRFESPLQVVGLFLAASVVSVGVIFFINAEAHSRQTHNHPQHQLPEPSSLVADDGDGWDPTKNEVGDPAMVGDQQKGISSDVSLSSSSSAELTSSNYTSGSESAVGGLGATPPSTNNVTLLNFLEDGLEKLLVLIKQAKHTYKSYYLSGRKLSQQAAVDSSTISSADCHPIKDNDTSPETGKDGGEEEATARSRKGSRSRRKKRDAPPPVAAKVMGVVKRMKRAAVISPSSGKRGRIGENEPYYWQMLEDNNRESSHHHHKKDKNEAVPQQRSSGSSNTNEKELYHSHQQNQNHHHHQQPSPHYHHHQQHQPHPHHAPHNQFGGGPENNHYIYPAGVPGAAPAVASAFTSGSGDLSSPNLQLQHGSSGGGSNHHSSTSDFHKIRHAMNKLGGGGLDISVVERMILDTKSSGRGHPSQNGGGSQNQNQQNHFGHTHFSPSGGRSNKDLSSSHHYNHVYAKSPSAASSESALLTTATTKTTHSGRQDEGLYVNQLRHQQQQLAQSLLPPTVTWLSGEGGNGGGVGGGDSTIRFLPLPSSSLATGSKQERKENDVEEEDENDDDNFNEGKQVNSNGDNDNSDDSNENSVRSSSSPNNTRKKNKHERQQQRRRMKMKRKKGKRKNDELSYSSSSKEGQDVERSRPQDEDYPLPYTRGDDTDDDEEQNNNNINASPDGDLVEDDGSDPSMGEDDEDNDNDKEGDDGLLFSNGIENDDDEEGEEDEDESNNADHEEKRRIDGDQRYSHPASTEHDGKTCYRTDDVLIVVAITCCLNFAFVLVIWALVRWFSISSNPKEKDFQNLGDCDDTLDPTVVFHGVTEDPCWALASKESGIGASGGATGLVGGGGGNAGMTLRSTASAAGGGSSRGHYERGEIGGYMGTLGSVHSGNKVDLFPIMGKHGGSALTNTIGAAVMTMTMERSRGGETRGGETRGGGGTGIYGHSGGGGSSSLMINGSGAGLYSFRPEHVPVHHGSSGQMHRSYSQSMEDLRYLQ